MAVVWLWGGSLCSVVRCPSGYEGQRKARVASKEEEEEEEGRGLGCPLQLQQQDQHSSAVFCFLFANPCLRIGDQQGGKAGGPARALLTQQQQQQQCERAAAAAKAELGLGAAELSCEQPATQLS